MSESIMARPGRNQPEMGRMCRMRIEYEDKDILVVYKEAGVPVQTGRVFAADLVSELKNYLAGKNPAETRGGEPYLGIIHRLDQPVEGLLVFAKNPHAAAQLSRQVSGKSEMRKVYHAVVLLPDQAARQQAERAQKKVITLVDWIGRDYAKNMAEIRSEGDPDAKRAELTYRILKMEENSALAEIHLHSGRHHQIRVQMAHAGMPLKGDRKYGDSEQDAGQLMLCACCLQFRHPSDGRKMSFKISPSFESAS